MKPIDIVITTWQREWMTELCLFTLRKNTNTPYRIIFIDNGSKYHSKVLHLNQSDIYVKMDKNYGLEYAKHIAMTFVESELFVSMDNDILVYNYEKPNWLERLVGLMIKYPTYAAIACRPQILVGTGMYMFDTQEEVIPFSHVPGYARIMRTDVVKATGAWSAKREGRGHEELWIGQELEKYNWKMGWANFVECIHLWGKEGEDPWGYPAGTESGHSPVWPMPQNDPKFIFEKTGVQI